MGVDFYGNYALLTKTILWITIISVFGIDDFLLKHISSNILNKNKIEKASRFLIIINSVIILFSLFLLLITIKSNQLFSSYFWCFFIILITTQLQIDAVILKIKGKVLSAIFCAESLPLLIILVYIKIFEYNFSNLLLVLMVGKLLGFIITNILLYSKKDFVEKSNSISIIKTLYNLKFTSIFQIFITKLSSNLSQVGLFLIFGFYLTSYDIGLLSILSMILGLSIIPSKLINDKILPKLRYLISINDLKNSKIQYRKIQIISFSFSFFAFLIFFNFSNEILLFWNIDKLISKKLIFVLFFGRLFSSIVGPVGYLYIFSDNEKELSYISLVVIIFSLLFSFLILNENGLVTSIYLISFTVFLDNLIKLIFINKVLLNKVILWK